MTIARIIRILLNNLSAVFSNKELYEAINFLKNSLVIPKPKFSVGDTVKRSDEYQHFIIVSRYYSLEQTTWIYEGISNKSVEEALVEYTPGSAC